VLQPLAVLPPQVGLALFVCISLLALLGSVVLLLRLLPAPRPPTAVAAVVACVALLPGALGVALAQWDPLMLLAGAAALVLLQRDRAVAAGLLLSVLLLKPHIAWLLLPVLLLAGMWRAALGFVAGGAVWALSTLALVGTGGVADWLHTLGAIRSWELGRAVSVAGWVANAGASSGGVFAATVLCALVGLAVLGTGWRRRALAADPLHAVGVAVALALCVSPHAWDHDLLLLALALVVLLRRSWTHAVGALALVDGLFLVEQALPTTWPRLQALSAPLVIAAVFLRYRDRGPSRKRSEVTCSRRSPRPPRDAASPTRTGFSASRRRSSSPPSCSTTPTTCAAAWACSPPR
jgi:hypothetical protein